MRVAFVLCGDLDRVSGGFLYDRRLIAGLRASAGVTVDVVSLPWRRHYARAWLDNLAPWPLHARDHDVVLEDQLCHPAVFWRNRRLRRHGPPVVSLVHNLTSAQPSTQGNRWVRACERAYFRAIDGVVAVCAGTLADVRRLQGGGTGTASGPAGALPAVVAYAGGDHVRAADVAAVVARAHAPGPLRLLFAGVVAPHKGLHRLLPVLARFSASAVRLDVAGSLTTDRRYAAAIAASIARLGLGDRVRLHGHLDGDRLHDLRMAAQVLVMPSDREAYPLAAVEGLAAGLPPLLTASGGTDEVLGASGMGRLVDVDNENAWYSAIADLVHDRARLADQARAALARHAAHGAWSDTAAGVHTFLKNLIAIRRSRPVDREPRSSS